MKTLYFRKGKTIRGPEGDKVFPSINAAKRESRAIQQAHGGLGCGVLCVINKPLKNKRPGPLAGVF